MSRVKVMNFSNGSIDFASEIVKIQDTQITMLQNEVKMKDDITELKLGQEEIKKDIKILDKKIDDSIARLDKKIDDSVARLNEKIDNGFARMDENIKEIGEILYGFSKKLDEKLDKK